MPVRGLLLAMFFFVHSISGFGQIVEADSVYKVEFKPFSPPVKAMINRLLYTQAQIFMAPDIKSQSHNLLNNRGKSVIMWFSKPDCPICEMGLRALFELKKEYGDEVVVYVFSNDSKKNLVERFESVDYNYNVMFNSKIFAEMMYAGSLGYPRMFLIDKEGYITKILPQEYIEQVPDLQVELFKMIDDTKQRK